ncbi:MAG: hypothetical protein EXR86_00905 [Gammaproteobacteria bacterium]|nr:hypothetical protein [Gammaproteobacteria bacterium]
MFTASPRRFFFALCLLGTAAYLPGLDGGFAFDDYPNIVENPALRPDVVSFNTLASAALSSDSGPLRRPLASLSFLANYHFFGIGPKSFKVVNLLIHLCNGWLIYLLLTRLMPKFLSDLAQASALAGFCALIWTLHPVNLTAVLFVVQRMTSLAAMFTLLALLCYSAARQSAISQPFDSNLGLWTGVGIFAVLGLATKENAVLLPLYALMIEVTVFKFRGSTWIKPAYVSALVVGVSCVVYLLGPYGYFDATYSARPFTASERLLTELRILVFYLGQIIFPNPVNMVLLHGNWTLSTGLFQPAVTAGAAAFWSVAIGTALATASRFPVVLFGVGWYLVGHVLESTYIPLELIYEHRNYLPMLGPVCLVCVGVACATEAMPSHRTLLAGSAITILAVMTTYRAWQWSDSFTLAFTEARHNPESARARMEYARVNFRRFMVEKRPELLVTTREELHAAIKYGDQDFHPLVSLVNSYLIANAPVPERILLSLQQEMRTANPALSWQDGVITLIRCQILRTCPANPTTVLRVTAAAFDNPRLQPAEKAEILEWLALYYTNVMGDAVAAARAIHDAVEIQPNDWNYRLRWAEILATQQAWREARREVRRVTLALTKFDYYLKPTQVARLETLRAKLALLE